MNLLEVYINEVTKRLPEKTRNEIEMELRASIEEMLPDDYTDEDVKKVLQTLGNPVELAYRYRLADKNHLIGPSYFENYLKYLLVAAGISLIIVFISSLVDGIFEMKNDTNIITFIVTLFVDWFVSSFNGLAHVFLWVTVGFVILERTDVSPEKVPKIKIPWNPDLLTSKRLVSAKRAISRVEVFFSIIWTVIWLALLANAQEWFGWYEQAGTGIEGLTLVAPLFNQAVLISYFPLLIGIAIIEFGLASYKLIVARWTFNLAVFNMIYQVLFVIAVCVMLSNSELFNPAFLTLMEGVLNLGAATFETNWLRLIWGSALMVIVFTIIDIAKGFINWKKS